MKCWIYNAPTESATTWDSIYQDLKDRGVQRIQLAIIDDLKGLQTFEKHFACRVQKCVLHLKDACSAKPKPVTEPSWHKI